jgi:regulatory protein
VGIEVRRPDIDAGSAIDARDPAIDAGDPDMDAGDPDMDAGHPAIDARDPDMYPGDPDMDAGDPAIDAGDPDMRAGLDRALAIAYRYLNRRESTEAEMRARLARADLDPPDVEQAIAILLEQGYLDDARFARLFAQDKRELDQWGSERIRQALHARGVPSELVEEATAAQPGEHPGESEIERALDLLRRKFPSPVGDRRERDRALGMLLRKGYDSDLALDAIGAHTREAPARNGDIARF